MRRGTRGVTIGQVKRFAVFGGNGWETRDFSGLRRVCHWRGEVGGAALMGLWGVERL